MRITRSIAGKFWLTLAGFSLALLLVVAGLFSVFFADYYVRWETNELVTQTNLVATEEDPAAARRLAMAIAADSGALILVCNKEGKVTDVLSGYGGPPWLSLSSSESPPPQRLQGGPRFRWGARFWNNDDRDLCPPLDGSDATPSTSSDAGSGQGARTGALYPLLRQVELTTQDKERLQRGEIVIRQTFLDTSGIAAERTKDSAGGIATLSVAIPHRKEDKVDKVIFAFRALQPINDTIDNVRAWVFGAGALTLLLSTLVAYLISKKVAQPLTALHAVAEQMRRGEFNRLAPVAGDDEIGRLGETLNSLSSELSLSLRQLEARNDQLAQGMQSMRDLAANVSHDLRTPLFLIQGYAEALRDDMAKTPEDRRQMAEIILEETDRMQRLVQDMLQLAQLESGYFELKREPVTPETLLCRVARNLAGTAEEQQIRLTCPPYPSDRALPEIYADPDRLTQALINLVDNALRHTPAGGAVQLGLAAQAESVRFTVNDTGPGLAEADLGRVWERFYRGEKSRSRKTPGAGLGLAIVKAIVESHGGQVGVENREGGGASFFFTIPTAAASQ
ncbi:HAMP domain-containing protein [Heliobacterium gestii]|uniref:histidine kinase n=1 Tax=Heliomicrobium gestii TaxID=2699 RepID=A0A845LB86_HELGE|nr:ATP-binding protein [Heliomicrobium gestii]MBM7866760.1 signal transduction histidine kinase [Heliomicrobium gestii]MZP42190.1 HAMP domain-containing protein [Heliomicrobium gestii]